MSAFDLEAREFERAEASGFAGPPAQARPAAGCILARDGPAGPEVLLVRRRSDLGFAAGAYVFPGGALDAGDRDPRWAEHADGWADHAEEVRPYAVAACRECLEETGVLLARAPHGPDPLPAAGVRALRSQLLAGRSFLELCAGAGLRLALDRLVWFAWWITPVLLPRRYEARFFLAPAPPGAQVGADLGELREHVWVAPRAALERYEAGAWPLMFPTATTLRWLCEGASVADWLARWRGRSVAPLLPRLRRTPDGVRPVLPGTPEYVEGALRLVRAPNPGPLTLEGTNTYVVGAHEVIVVDPGPDDPAHLDAVVRAVPERARVTAVAITHAHGDHAAGAPALAARFRVPLLGSALALERVAARGGPTVERRALAGGETWVFDAAQGGDALEAIEAPGHSADHLCFLWREARALFSGDTVLGRGSAMIAPPDGELDAYLRTLERLRGLELRALYPGHGPVLTEPRERIEDLLAHRRARTREILEAIRAGARSVEAIRQRVYGPLEPALARGAEANVAAHLRALVRAGVVVEDGPGTYRLARDPEAREEGCVEP